MKTWVEPLDVSVPTALQTMVGGHPLVAATLARRGFTSVARARAFLTPDEYTPAPPSELLNMNKAVVRLEAAIRDQEPICVWGDFDVDGQTSTTLLVSTLHDLGAAVSYHIPVRATESHGIKLPALEKVIAEGAGLILTCDTGVAEHESIAYAQTQGVDVIVTDHHTLPPALPEAHAIVNPQMLPADHPLNSLPGVGCAYKLAEALYDRSGCPADVEKHLDLVALGIVADVALQIEDARYLLQRGLEALRRTERLGLQVLMETAELEPATLSEEHIGFVLGPRMNALGRLADANAAVELLTTTDRGRARILATQLEGLNAKRKLLTGQVFQAALAQIDQDASLLDHAALVLSHTVWPAGVIGLVASRLAERYNRPTLLIATPEGEIARGSARSVQGCNITAAIAAQSEMLAGFGGHPMAAGISIDPGRIPEFRRALSRTVQKMMGDVGREASLQVDGTLSLADISLDLVADLERLAPFGAGNPALTLVSQGLSLNSQREIGRNGEHLQLIVEDESGVTQKVIWWQGVDWPLPQGKFDLAYVVRSSNYRGKSEVLVEWIDARQVEEPAVEIRTKPRSIEIEDYRLELDPLAILKRLQNQRDIQVWREAETDPEIAGHDRYDLSPALALAIWTAPPGPQELKSVLAHVSPEKVYLFGVNPGLDQSERFLKRLAGLLKYALSSTQGRAKVANLAAATAQREDVIRRGITWLAAKGLFEVSNGDDDKLEVSKGAGKVSVDLPELSKQLQALLSESAAYRAHFLKADKDRLIPSQSARSSPGGD